MTRAGKAAAVLALCAAGALGQEAEPGGQDGPIAAFENRFSAGVNARYNFLMAGGDGVTAVSNTPVFLGFSFGYRDYALFFSVAQTYTYTPGPGTRPAFDASLGFYQHHWFEELSFKYYDDFYQADQDQRPVDLRYVLAGVAGEYVFNAEAFTLRAVFPMSRVQRVSAGSFIAGGNIRFFALTSGSAPAVTAADNAWYLSAGPNAGYSYTFVMDGGGRGDVSKNDQRTFFVNLYVLGGINLGLAPERLTPVLSAFVTPRITVGTHFRTWSFNFVTRIDYSVYVFGGGSYATFLYGAASPGFSRRF